jgi:DNA-binding MarR family transcriptional regulator
VSGKLADELRQSRPFASVEEEAVLNLARTHEFAQQRMAGFFKQFHLTATQYNILRILRGAGEQGLTCSEVGGRLISRDPDMTRLLDRMESRGWIARAREKKDRRVVTTRITAEGLRILAELDEPIRELHRRQLRHLPEKQLRQLSQLLERARENTESQD